MKQKLPDVVHELADRWNSTPVWHSMKPGDSAWFDEIHVTVKDCKDCADFIKQQRMDKKNYCCCYHFDRAGKLTGEFDIYEYEYNKPFNFMFTISPNKENLIQELRKRGIPDEESVRLSNEMIAWKPQIAA